MAIASSGLFYSDREREAMGTRIPTIYDIAVFLKNLTDRWREFGWQISEPTFWPIQGPFWRRGHFEQVPTESLHR
jgi:hypothetical protein